MNSLFPIVKIMGARAILIEFEPRIGEDILSDVLFYKRIIEDNFDKQKVEVTTTYSSLLIIYRSDIEDVYSSLLKVKGLLLEADINKKEERRLFQIPICYEDQFGLDLEYVAAKKNLTKQEIISLHTAPVYIVYFIGFLPGFFYLGGLDKRLEIPRKHTPRNRVEKGAVGIGENQTGIYPKSSPGGWQIIGNSPIELFDKNSLPPCEIFPGDRVKFYAVSLEEFESIKSMIHHGKYQLKTGKYEGGN